MYPNSHRDVEKSFVSESQTEELLKEEKVNDLVCLVDSHSREIQEFIHRLKAASPVVGIPHMLGVIMYDDQRNDFQNFLEQLLKGITPK